MREIRGAIAGVGNCAWSFCQFVEAAQQDPDAKLPGLMEPEIGGYRLSDVKVVVAFDVDFEKVGKELAEAFDAPTINSVRARELKRDGSARVLPSPVLDGLDGPLGAVVTTHADVTHATVDSVEAALREHQVDVLILSLPTGAVRAARMFAAAAAAAKVSAVNATPTSIAREAEVQKQFAEAGAVIPGDDLRSHLGATTLHAALVELMLSRGIMIDDTYQLNVGGNTDFLNLADANRSLTKIASKGDALRAAGLEMTTISAGPSGYIPSLGDTKVCYLNIRGTSVLGTRLEIDLKLRVEDSPNAAGVLANSVRLARTAIDRGLTGDIGAAGAVLFKSPPDGLAESAALDAFRKFASGS